jgi:pimeloyl-ACP methyl ester carboxylesterase
MIQALRHEPGIAPALPQDRYFDGDGARLRYRDEGAGPAVVFVHGWALDLDIWEPQAAALCADYRVIRLDRRGFGLSSGIPSLVDDAADLQALCRHLQLQRIALVGMSQGARVALHTASVAPAMVACLILDGPPSIAAANAARDPQDLPYEDYRRLAQTGGMSAFRREWLRHPLARLMTDDAAAQELLARIVARYPGKDLIGPLPGPSLITTPAAVQSIVPPVLVVGGALDIDSRKQSADELALALPRAERAEIPNAGHLCNLDNPQAYTSALRNFLEHPMIARTQP